MQLLHRPKMLKVVLCLFLHIILACCHLHEYVEYFETLNYDKERLLHDHHRLRRSALPHDNELRLSFEAFDRPFNLRLIPDNKDTDFNIIVDGKPHPVSSVKPYFYVGYDENDPTAVVQGSLAFGVFDGTIHGSEDTYYMEPADRYFNNATDHSVIYRISDSIMNSSASFCGAANNPLLKRSVKTMKDNHLHTRDSSNRDPQKTRCWLNVIGDYYFYNAVAQSTDEATRIAQATSIIKNIVSAGSINFETTDFDGNGIQDNINFAIRNITIHTNNNDETLSDKFLGVEALLNLIANNNYDDFCLSYLFTYRDFDQGILGLAFIADSGSTGGVCAKHNYGKSYNTGLVSLLNYGKRVTRLVSELTFTHEAGHNFGAQHDTAECNEDGNNYVMFSFASDGRSSNNNKFSQCSKTSILSVLRDTAQSYDDDVGCLLYADDNCGNFLLDPGEYCDCGFSYNSVTRLCNDDPCCNGSSCMLALNVECSPQQGPCCDKSCTFVPLFPETLCSNETDCSYNQTCNGTTSFCPTTEPKQPKQGENAIPCNSGSNYCVDGECTGSICIPLLLSDCECLESEYQCHVCCRLVNGTCVSTVNLAAQNNTARDLLPDGMGSVKGVGFPCSSFEGYCDFFDACRGVNSEGAIKRLTNLVTGSGLVQTIVNYITRYWWAGLIGVVGVLFVSFLIVIGCHFFLPRPEHMKNRRTRRKNIRRTQSRKGTRNGT